MSGSPLPRPAAGAAPEWQFPPVERFSLASGLSVLTCNLPNRPVIDVKLVLDGGFAREEPRQAGLAAVTATAAAEGTELRPADAFYDAVDNLGADFGIGATWHGLVPAMSVPRTRLIPALDLLTEALAAPAFRIDDIERTIRRRADQLAMEHTMPGSAADYALARRAYAEGVRCSVPAGGTPDAVSAIQPDHVRTWWATHVRPAGATLIIVGDLRGLDIETVLAKTFGQRWASEAAPVAEGLSQAPAADGGCVVVDFPQAVQTTIVAGQVLRPFEEGDEIPFKVAVHGLGGYFSSRLVAKLREERGLTYGVRATVEPRPDGNLFKITTAVDQAVTAEAVVIIREEIAATAKTLEDVEVRNSVANLIESGPVRFTSVSAVSDSLVANVLNGRPDDYYDIAHEQLRRVTAADAVKAFDRYVSLDRLVIAAAGPAARIHSELEPVVGDVTVQGSDLGAANRARGAGAPVTARPSSHGDA